MKLPWKKENAAHKASGGGKRRSFDLKAALTTRAVRVGGYSVAAAAIVIAIIVAANALVRALPAQWTQFDTTSSQLFSISDQTESVVGSLETPVTIHWIVQSGQEDATLETLLERYQALSENLTVEKVDPVVSPTFLEQYDVGSVYNNSLIVESEARYRYVDYYDIYTYDYSSYYTTGSVDMNFAGEGAITSAVSYVVNDDLPKVYTLTGHGEGSLSSDFQSAAEQDNVEFEELSLLSAETVPEDADCVLILAPQSDISDVELTALQAYLDGGGRLLLITDPPQEGAELTNLETLMAGYGVHAVDGIVVEEDQANYAMGLPYTVTREVSTVTDEEGEESQEVAYLLDGAEVEFQDLLDDLNAMASTGSAVGLTPERSAQISFTFHRNTETFPQMELVFYQYDSSNCLVSLDGEVVLLATREDVEAIVETAAALIPEA